MSRRHVGCWLVITACWSAFVACGLAADPESAPSVPQVAAQPRGVDLQRAARQALADAARRKTPPDDVAVRQLVTLYEQLMLATDLPAAQREPLRIAVRRRLEADRAILAQVGLPQIGMAPPQAQQAATLAPELIELIESTINPASWDKLGGPGVIRFWGPSNALVVRQTTEAHEALEQLLQDIR